VSCQHNAFAEKLAKGLPVSFTSSVGRRATRAASLDLIYSARLEALCYKEAMLILSRINT
jgi:hypothetical protein